MKNWIILLLLIITGSQVIAAKTLSTFQATKPPTIDGRIDVGEWVISDSTTDWIQLEPRKGSPSSQQTIIYSVYDKDNIYFAFTCFDTSSNIVANIYERDQIRKSDDAIFILLDSFLDKRSAFGFFVNPLGTQTDIKFADDGRNQDINWDAKWETAASVHSWGWSAEVAIPFTSINYDASLSTWGINFGRVIRTNSETCYWAGPINDDYRISQGGLLSGLELESKGTRILFTPYSTVRRDERTIGGNEYDLEAGFDASVPITSGINGNITYNPDFATVEGDQERINLTRWELSFPEKRLFFLEGGELFATRIRTFYTRRIGDIDYGAKVTGKAGKYNLAIMNVKTRPDPVSDQAMAYFSVLRLKSDILKSSTIGITIADKSWRDGYTRSFSTDYVLNLGRSWKMTGQLVGSAPGKLTTRMAYFLRVANESNIHHAHVRYSDTGKDFKENVNQTGFIRDDDMKEVDSDLIYRWWHNGDFLEYIHFSSRNNIFWNHANVLRSWYVTESIRTYLSNRMSLDISYNDEFKLYEEKFYNHKYGLTLGYNTDEWNSESLGYSWGHNYNRDFTIVDGSVNIKPLAKLSMQYSLKYLDYTPDPTDESTFINVLTLDYNFTRDLWFRVFTQNNSKHDRIYFYGLFAWRFQPPFGAVYLIYTTDRFDNLIYSRIERNRTIFLKFAYQITI